MDPIHGRRRQKSESIRRSDLRLFSLLPTSHLFRKSKFHVWAMQVEYVLYRNDVNTWLGKGCENNRFVPRREELPLPWVSRLVRLSAGTGALSAVDVGISLGSMRTLSRGRGGPPRTTRCDSERCEGIESVLTRDCHPAGYMQD